MQNIFTNSRNNESKPKILKETRNEPIFGQNEEDEECVPVTAS